MNALTAVSNPSLATTLAQFSYMLKTNQDQLSLAVTAEDPSAQMQETCTTIVHFCQRLLNEITSDRYTSRLKEYAKTESWTLESNRILQSDAYALLERTRVLMKSFAQPADSAPRLETGAASVSIPTPPVTLTASEAPSQSSQGTHAQPAHVSLATDLAKSRSRVSKKDDPIHQGHHGREQALQKPKSYSHTKHPRPDKKATRYKAPRHYVKMYTLRPASAFIQLLPS